MHLIKKYANRKLYDIKDKKYITMKHISEIIKSGKDVSIIDNKTGEDITASIVSTLMGKESNEAGETLSTGVLIQLFRRGSGALTDYAKKHFSIWQNAFTMAEDELDNLLKTLVKNKEISKTEGSRLKQEITGFTRSLKTWISEMVDKRINEITGVMNLPTRDQFVSLNARISELEAKIKTLELQNGTVKTGKSKRVNQNG